jgi:hypothetical protein
MIGRALRTFGRFWWEFLVGDTPELLGAAAAVVALAVLLRHQRDVAYVVLPITAIAFLVASTVRGAERPSEQKGTMPSTDAADQP